MDPIFNKYHLRSSRRYLAARFELLYRFQKEVLDGRGEDWDKSRITTELDSWLTGIMGKAWADQQSFLEERREKEVTEVQRVESSPSEGPSRWKSYADARKYVSRLGLKSKHEWDAMSSVSPNALDYPKVWLSQPTRLRPPDIPSNPDRAYYGRGWQGWGHFLGTGTVATQCRKYRDFDKAREFSRSLKLVSQREWKDYCCHRFPNSPEKPEDIPSCPQLVYKGKGWTSWGDWVGTDKTATWKRAFLPFEQARAFAHSLNLGSRSRWVAWRLGYLKDTKGVRPKNIPSRPDRTYRGAGWASWPDWLGAPLRGASSKTFLPFEEAREIVRKLDINNSAEWHLYAASGKRPPGIPSHPDRSYSGRGWAGMADWLGHGRGRHHRNFSDWRPFSKARQFVRQLGLVNSYDWEAYRRGDLKDTVGVRPSDIPSNPERIYRGRGWRGTADWLGYYTGNPGRTPVPEKEPPWEPPVPKIPAENRGDGYLTPEEFAAIMGVRTKTVYDWTGSGKLRGVMKVNGGNRSRIPVSEITRILTPRGPSRKK